MRLDQSVSNSATGVGSPNQLQTPLRPCPRVYTCAALHCIAQLGRSLSASRDHRLKPGVPRASKPSQPPRTKRPGPSTCAASAWCSVEAHRSQLLNEPALVHSHVCTCIHCHSCLASSSKFCALMKKETKPKNKRETWR